MLNTFDKWQNDILRAEKNEENENKTIRIQSNKFKDLRRKEHLYEQDCARNCFS